MAASMTDEGTAFIKIPSPPEAPWSMVKINDYEFVGVTNEGLYKFNILSNEWKLLLNYAKDFITLAFNHVAYDSENGQIFSYGSKQQMTIFNLKTLEIEKIAIEFAGAEDPQLLMIKDECHVILGKDSKYHYKWNIKLKKLEKIYEFTDLGGLYEHGVVYIESQNKALLFGGYKHNDGECSDEIWEFNTNNDQNKWIKLENIILPIEMSEFDWILSKDEDYLIIFGGESDYGGRINGIFILDLIEMEFYRSTVELPQKERVYVVSMSNRKSEILLSGYMRAVWNEYDLNIPKELMGLLHGFCESETVYLYFDAWWRKENTMYSIEVSDILNSKTSNLSVDYFAHSDEDEDS